MWLRILCWKRFYWYWIFVFYRESLPHGSSLPRHGQRSKSRERWEHWPMNYIDTKAKCDYLKKLTCKWTFCRCLICLRPPPLLDFCLGWCNKFVGSESGQIESVKLMQNMVSSRSQHPPPPPSHTLSVYIVFDTGKGGGGGELNQREGQMGNSSQSWVENTNMSDCISSL